MSMSYANMIENRHLKKTFVLAVTVSAIVSCLSSAHSLHSHVRERRKKKKEKETFRKVQKQEKDVEIHHLARSLDQQLGLSADQIGQEYDRNYYYLGQRFAQGDLTAQSQLQEEVIALQRLLIDSLQSIYLNNRDITPKEYDSLLSASEAARASTVSVLRGQCRRLLEAGIPQPMPQNPKRRVVLEDVHHGAAGRPPLYCGYATVLQQNENRPLSPSFDRRGRLRCPACSAVLDIEQGKAWKITKDVIRTASNNANCWTWPDLWFSTEPVKIQQGHTGYHGAQSASNRGGQQLSEIQFHVTNRFIVKCHRENGELACVLCYQNRPIDTIWDSMSDLVKHVQTAHDIEEYRQEVDIKEVAEQ